MRNEIWAGGPKDAFDNVKNWMFVLGGKRMYIDNPRLEDFDIETIAHALSVLPRFGGQTRKPFNIAQHSMIVSSLCPDKYKLFGLLHDASECYLGDIIRPLKYTPEVYNAYAPIEERFMGCIAKKFKFKMGKLAQKVVKKYDDIVGRTEMRDLVELPPDFEIIGETLDTDLSKHVMSWQEAKHTFLETYYAITGKRK